MGARTYRNIHQYGLREESKTVTKRMRRVTNCIQYIYDNNIKLCIQTRTDVLRKCMKLNTILYSTKNFTSKDDTT